MPSEMGLAEAHQALVVNGLRKAVKLRVGGGIKNGHDVIKYALFGADEFSFGQALMVSVGCIVCKSCHIPNCPTGITGSPRSSRGTRSTPRRTCTRSPRKSASILAQMGFTHLAEITGRSRPARSANRPEGEAPACRRCSTCRGSSSRTWRSRGSTRLTRRKTSRPACAAATAFAPEPARSSTAAYDAIDTAQNADLVFRVRNSDRSVGATVAGMIAKLYGREGMPNHRKIKVRLDGEAGQSFGAWCVNGLDLELRGFAQDGVAKGISGGTVVVTLDYTASDYGGEIQSVAGQQRRLRRDRRHDLHRRPRRPPPRHPQLAARPSSPRRRGSTPAST